jgi:hypothetical protein
MGEIVAMQPLERYENSASTCPDEARRLGLADCHVGGHLSHLIILVVGEYLPHSYPFAGHG